MISRVKKNISQVSFRERITTSSIVHIDFFIALLFEVLALSNIIIVVSRNLMSKFDSILLFLLHMYRLDSILEIIPVTILLVFSFLIIFYSFWYRNRISTFGLIAKILPLGCALLLIQIESHIFYNINKNSPIPFEFFIIIFIIASVWIIKLIAFPQNYITKQCKLTKFPILLRTFVFIMQIFFQIFKINISIFIVSTLACQILHMLFSLVNFQYICKDFEYLYFLSKYLTITVNVFYLLQITSLIPKNWLVQCIPYALFLILFTSDLLKTIFQKKYSRILKNDNLTPSQTIVLYNILLNQKKSDDNSIFNFSPDNFEQNILMKQFIQQQKKLVNIKQPEQASLINSQNPKLPIIQSPVHCQDIDYILIWLQKQQARLHSEFLTIYLCFFYLSQKNYLKSIQYLMKARKIKNYQRNLNLSLIYQLFNYQLEHHKSISNSLNIIVELQQSYYKSCFINYRYKTFLDLNHLQCIQLELQIQELVKKIEKLVITTSSIIRILDYNNSSNNIESKKIKYILLQKLQEKHQIEILIQRISSLGYQSKKFIFLYYVYLNLCCQSYIVFEKLKPLLDIATGDHDRYLEKKSSENDMMVIVSIQDESLGVIEYANVLMKTFFCLKQHKINSKRERIQKIIPKSIASHHNELMMQFKKTGRSNFIGKRNKLIAIQNQQKPYQVYIDIKIFVSLNGSISLTSRIIVIKEEANIILFDSFGKILENTLDLKVAKRKSKLGNLNIFKIINVNIQPKLRKIKPQTFTADFQNRLAKIMIDSFEFKDDYLGICKIKFLNKTLVNIKPTLKKRSQKTINSLKSLSDKQNRKRSSEGARKLYDLEQKIYNMKIPYHVTFVFVIFFIISLAIVVSSFIYIQYQLTYSSNIAGFYINILSGFRTRFFLMNNRYLLLHAINNNIIPDNITTIYNISSLSKYIKDTTPSYLSTFDALDSLIINYSLTVPTSYIDKFANSVINYLPPYQFQISWVSMLSLMKSFYYQTLFEKANIFESMWNVSTLKFNNYLNNDFFSQNNNKIYIDTISKSVTAAQITGDNINGLIYFMAITLFLLVVVILFILNKIHTQTQQSILLLVDIDISSWKTQQEKIQLIKEGLKDLTQMTIINYEIEYEFESIKYYFEQGNILTMEYGQIYFQNMKSDNFKKQIPQMTLKKSIQKSSFIRVHIYYILIIILFSLPLFGMYLQSLTISTSNYDATTFFYSYMNQIANFRISQSIMLNIAAAQIILPVLPKFNNMDVKTIIPNLKANILNRTYEDILKKSLSWNLVSDSLYKPSCKSTDKICKTLISGSLNQNIPASLVQFSNLNFMLYSNSNNLTNTSARNALLCQLWFTFQTYLRSMLKQLQSKGLDIMNSKLAQTQSQLTLIFQKAIIPLMIIFLVIGYCIAYKMFKQSYQIKRQILMCDKVNHLIDKVTFRKQFIQLK